MFQELKFQLSTAILTILTLAAGVAAVVNFEQYEHFRLPDDGVIWVDRAGHVEALYVVPNGPAANWVQPGDWLMIFTDGLVEAMNAAGEEYGQQRVLNVLNAGASATPAEMLVRIMSDLDAFVGDTAQHDDVTCMIVKAG